MDSDNYPHGDSYGNDPVDVYLDLREREVDRLEAEVNRQRRLTVSLASTAVVAASASAALLAWRVVRHR